MKHLRIIVEGGGKGKKASDLSSQLRIGFVRLVCTYLGVNERDRKFDFFPAGSRVAAKKAYEIAVKQGNEAILLLDSEDLLSSQSCMEHLKNRPHDRMEWSAHARPEDIHLMVTTMESWFLADPDALKDFYGQGFNGNKFLKPGATCETIYKHTVNEILKVATEKTSKGKYHKGSHSGYLIGKIDPHKVIQASPKAKSFFQEVQSRA
jgi:Domain of unknown function (DUF4276)